MGTTFPMMPWFPRDFLSSTRGWSVTARGVFRELLDAQWDLGVLPADPEQLRLLIGATSDEWADGWSRCGLKFNSAVGGLQNIRLEERRAESVRIRDRRVQAAEQTNAKRYGQRDGERHGERVAKRNGQRVAERAHSASASASAPTPEGVSFGNSRRLPPTVPAEFHKEVIGAYHELCPELPRVKVWTDKRKRWLNARICERLKDGKPADGVEYWREFFAQVAASDHLNGRGGGWRSDLEWLLNKDNFPKVIEGRYN